jgi:hypothetical protein
VILASSETSLYEGVAVQVKMKYVLVTLCIIALFGVSQILLPTSNSNQTQTTDSRAYWLDLATKAWQFFEPGQAVNTQTGLHGAGLGWPYFTEWDLGTYLQAMLDAKQLGILQDNGQWGFNNRVSKIIDFLKTRQLTNSSVPYLMYDSRTGEPYQDAPSFCIDEGKLYMALYNLKNVKPNLAQDIDYIVKVRNNNTEIVPNPEIWLNSTDLYCYYIANAFRVFQFEGWDNVQSSIINTIVSQPNVTTYGVELPSAHICSEPLLETVFEVKPQDSKFDWLLSHVYQAHEARYEATGHYTAFSEGNTGLLGSNDPTYVYEFVVDRDGSTWKVTPEVTPVAYFKVAVGFQAIFNTEYTKSMVEYMSGILHSSSSGFQDGVDENGRVVDTYIDRTNGLIIAAANYAIEKLPAITPSPSLTPTATPSPTPTLSLSPTLSATPTPSPSSSPSSTSTQSQTSSPSPTANPTANWYNEPLILVSVVFVVCLTSVFILVLRFRRNTSKTISEKL